MAKEQFRRERVKVATLVLDYSLYPRHSIDLQNVRYLKEAMAAEAHLPPIIVDRETRKVIDGFHRCAAAVQLHGEDAEVEVEWHTYSDKKAMLLAAIAPNARHGFRLSRWDQVRCLALGEELKIDRNVMAAALSMPEPQALSLMTRRLGTFGLAPYTLKHSTEHYAGQELTADQDHYNQKAGGLNQTFYVNQVILMLTAKTTNEANPHLVAALLRLKALLAEYSPKETVSA